MTWPFDWMECVGFLLVVLSTMTMISIHVDPRDLWRADPISG